jgi:succinate-acetate transporter protein
MSAPAAPRPANPAVIGLAGFGLTTMLLQFHNLGWMGLGPVLGMGLLFGGLAQFLAGLMEQKMGNDFATCAFTGYGAFWIALGGMFLGKHFGIFPATRSDVGWFLVAWTVFTFILWVGSLRLNGALAVIFTLLLIGFILLDWAHFCDEAQAHAITRIAAWELLACAASALYLMAANVYRSVFGREVLPIGKAWWRDAEAPALASSAPCCAPQT